MGINWYCCSIVCIVYSHRPDKQQLSKTDHKNNTLSEGDTEIAFPLLCLYKCIDFGNEI